MARRLKKDLLKMFGTTFEIFSKISAAVFEGGGNDDDLRRVLTSENLATQIGEMIIASRFAHGNMLVSPFFPVIVDPARTLGGMLRQLEIRLSCQDWHIPLINSGVLEFRGKEKSETEVAIVEFKESTAYAKEEAIDRLDKSGLQPAKIEHLLSFTERYPEKAYSFWMAGAGNYPVHDLPELVAMGSSVDRVADGKSWYPAVNYDNICGGVYISFVGDWNMMMGRPPRLLVTRKQAAQ